MHETSDFKPITSNDLSLRQVTTFVHRATSGAEDANWLQINMRFFFDACH